MALDPAERRTMIEHIRDFPQHLEAAIHDLSDEDLITPYLDGEWTVNQIVHHLADAGIAHYTRMKLCLTEDQPTIKTIDINEWAKLADADQPSLQSSLWIIRGLHERLYVLLSALPEEMFERAFNHPLFGVRTLDDLVQSCSGHGYGHVEQIKETLAAKTADRA